MGSGWHFRAASAWGENLGPGTGSDAGADGIAMAGVLALALAPSLAAVGLVPWFVTQDGPAHVYNAEILRASLRPDSPYRGAYAVRWDPLPNWAGHLALMGLLEVLPARAADRAIMALTLAGFAGSIAWLRWRVARGRGLGASALAASMLGMNLTWLFGFWSFLLGSALYALTLGAWWSGRDRLGAWRASGLGALLVLGYFCHPISLGLTCLGLVVLAVATPGPAVGRRLAWTLASFAPLVPLGWLYRGLMRSGGSIRPIWGSHLADPWSLGAWRDQLGWVDPLTLGSKAALPFVEARSAAFGLLNPMLWTGLGLVALVASGLAGRGVGRPAVLGERRGWALLAALLLVGGVVSPDTLGPSHGYYLSQRVFLLGLVALVPLLETGGSRALAWSGTAALGVAVAVQSSFVWDYARASDRRAGEFLEVEPHVGRGVRLGTLLLELRGAYRVNPLLHLDAMLGVGTGNIVWTNYETAHYYFPVQVRPGVPHPPVLAFEDVSILDDPRDADRRAAMWARLLEAHHGEVDVLVTRGRDARLDAITARWYEVSFEQAGGPMRVWCRRAGGPNRARPGA